MPNLRILIVDDDPAVGRALARSLPGHEVTTCADATEALMYLRGQANPRPDLILTDTNMPGMKGPDFLKVVRDEGLAPDAYCVIMSGMDQEVAQAAQRVGLAHAFLVKPWRRVPLDVIVADALAHRAPREPRENLAPGQ